ncbi:MAG: peptidoglycan DD-metalloendopeptidase family protein [Treponema sp.]|nr:peptidoglycan DD-metalloendopeptidase family protein [Candidatus Treponema equifaecale]
MEVYSFVGASSSIRKPVRTTERNYNFPSLKLKSTQVQKPVFAKIAEKKAVAAEKVSLEGVARVFALVLVLAILAVVPVTVFNVLSYFESHTSPLKIDSSFALELEALDGAMSKFAMESVVADVDENGNVLADDGSVLTAASVGLGQAVTFRDYKVASGDSISTIARKFGLSNISTLIAVNNIENVRSLRSGQKLKIPSQDGMVHKVGAGESLNALSVRYHVSVEEILDANDLTSENLSKGMELFIPGAKMDSAALKKAMGELFVNPLTVAYRLTSRFGPRSDPFSGVPSNHKGIDMACPQGSPIRASMSGKVVYVGWSNIFGNYVIIDHGNGYQSLYGHMLKSVVKNGLMVDSSTKIGLVGSTGYSTGPHLHFQVFKNGKLVDPLSLIKR